MKKQVLLFIGITFLLTSMISAYSYNPASIGAFFDTLGGENLGLIIIFGVSFALISVILNRTGFFGENRSASAVIALLISGGITYGTYKQGIDFNVAGLVYGLGVSETTLDILVFFGVLGLIILLLFKFGANSLLIIGGFILALIFMGVVQDPGILIIIGFVLVGLWMIIAFIKHRKSRYMRTTHIKGGLNLSGLGKR